VKHRHVKKTCYVFVCKAERTSWVVVITAVTGQVKHVAWGHFL